MSYDKFYELFETQIDRKFPRNQRVLVWHSPMIPQAFYKDDETRQQAIDYLINNGYQLHRENQQRNEINTNERNPINTNERNPNETIFNGTYNANYGTYGFKNAYVENEDGTINQYRLYYNANSTYYIPRDYSISREKMLSEGTIKPVSSRFAKPEINSIVNPVNSMLNRETPQQNNVLGNPYITTYIQGFSSGLNWKPATRLFETEHDRYANVAPYYKPEKILPQAFFEKKKNVQKAIENRQKAIDFLLSKGYELFRENQHRADIDTIPPTNHVYAYVQNEDGLVNQYKKKYDSQRDLNILSTQIKNLTGGKKQRKSTKKNKRSMKKIITKNNKRSMKKRITKNNKRSMKKHE
jgi:hypothetical protein